MLSDVEIHQAMAAGSMAIVPLPASHAFQPVSVDLRFGNSWRFCSADEGMGQAVITETIKLNPGQFALGCTLEHVELSSHIVGQVHGKSTLARQGLQVHAAGLVDPGFHGQLTLELWNMAPVPLTLSAGQLACQITFERLTTGVGRPYGAVGLLSHYQGQRGATAAR